MHKYKIIHVDDHVFLAKGIQKYIKSAIPGCSFKSFRDGNNAYAYIEKCIKRKNKIDMVITDIIHPGMNGYTFSCNIRKLEKKAGTNSVPILVLSILDSSIPKLRNAMKMKIFDDYVQLDSNPDVLITSVRKRLMIQ